MRPQTILLTILSAVLSLSALCSLPDEINYPPYQAAYLKLADKVAELSTELERLENSEEENFNGEQKLIDLVFHLEQKNRKISEQIYNNEMAITSLLEKSRGLNQKIQRMTRGKVQLKSRERNLLTGIERENRRLAPLKEKVVRVRKRKKNKKEKLQVQNIALKKLQDITKRKKTVLQQQIAQKKKIKKQLISLKEKLANTNINIQAAKKIVANTKTSIQQTKPQLIEQRNIVQKLMEQLKLLRTELAELSRTDRSNPKVKELKAKVVKKTKKVNIHKLKAKNLKVNIDNAKIAQKQAQQEIENLIASKNILPTKIAEKKEAVKNKNALIQQKKNEFEKAKLKRAEQKSVVDLVIEEVKKIQTRLEHLREKLGRESRAQNEMISELTGVQNELGNVLRNLQYAINENNRVLQEISVLEDEIPYLENNINTNRIEISHSNRALISIRENILTVQAEIVLTKQNLTQNIQERDYQYSEFSHREQLYKSKHKAAKLIGANQAKAAEKIAQEDSDIYVIKRSGQLGNRIGSELANIQASYWASVRSEVKGYKNGFSIGYASTEEQERGHKEGDRAGYDEAIQFAETVLKPKFFNEFFEDQLGYGNHFVRDLILKANDEFTKSNVELFLYENDLSVSDSEIEESYKLETNLDQKILQFEKNLEATNTQVNELSVAVNAYEHLEIIPYGKVDCSGSYKEVPQFIASCKKTYKKIYKRTYTKTHYENFEMQYPRLYKHKLETKRADIINVIYDNEFIKYFEIANAFGVGKGNEAVFNESFILAKTEAYNEELPMAEKRVKIVADAEVTNWIKGNASLTLSKEEILGDKLKGGSVTNLSLIVKNISPKALVKPVKIIIDQFKNINSQKNIYYLKNADGNSITDFNKISFKINSDVPSNTEVSISGRILFPGGKYQKERIEKFSATKLTVLNPAIGTELTYGKTPRIVTRIRRKTLIHNLEIKLHPKVEYIASGYKVNFEVMPDSLGLIKIRRPNAITGGLKKGEIKKLRFQYTLLLAGRGKTLQVKLNYSHKGIIVKSEIIAFQPF